MTISVPPFILYTPIRAERLLPILVTGYIYCQLQVQRVEV